MNTPIGSTADRPFGWLLAIAVPFATYFYLKRNGLDSTGAMFVAVVSGSLIMWMFSLVADFVSALLALLLCLLLGLAPLDVVLSGFSSNGFLLTFSILGLGVVITSSGSTYRYTLLLIKRLPAHTFWYQLALFFTGLLFTPFVPSIAGRAAITAPILSDMAEGIGPKTLRRSSRMLYFSGLDGVSFMSAAFLTSAPANLIIFGMLPFQEQQAFQFIHWAYAASLTCGLMLLMYFLLSAAYFRAYGPVSIDMQTIERDLTRLGPMSWREWFAFFGIVVLALGIITASIHKIPVPYIAFTVFFILLYLGLLTPEDFSQKINWPFLFLLASLIGILSTMSYLELDKLLSLKLSWLGDYMISDFNTFVLALSAAVLIVRLSLPINSTVLIFAAALLPIANTSGVNPWLIGFVILIMAETSLFSYQSPHILLFRNMVKTDLNYSELDWFVFHALLLAAKLIAIYASIPFWSRIGIL